MTKFALRLTLVAIAGLSVAGLAHADLKSDLLAARKKQERAAMAKNVKAAEAAARESLTSDFKYVQGGSTQDTKTYISNMTAGITMMDKISTSSTRILGLNESGKNGSAKVELKMTGIMKGSDKKAHKFAWSGVFNEEFRKVGGKWKMAKMTAGAQKFLLDGKPANM